MDISAFWDWFTEHQERLFHINEENQGEILHEIIAVLKDIHPGLCIEISSIGGEKRRLEISANGDIEIFDLVQQVVEAAPAYRQWDIVAFRQPTEGGFVLTFGDLVLDTARMFFLPYEEEGFIDIVIYGENFRQYEQQLIAEYGLIVMDNLLGEYDSATKVRYYEFEDISEAGAEELYPLEALPLFLEDYYAERKDLN